MVALVGLEPTRYRYHWILSPARLPISPQGHFAIILYHNDYFNSRKFICFLFTLSSESGKIIKLKRDDVMINSIIIGAVTIALMIFLIIRFPKIKISKYEFQTFWIVPLVSSVLILLLGILDFEKAIEGLTADVSVNPIKILILFFSMTFMSIVLDELGFFDYLANLALKKAKSNQKVLFFTLYILTSILTVFTSNDIIILTFTPFIIFFTKSAKINPIPYLVSEFVAANTWSMMFIIGNPTNIYLATSSNLDFIGYFLVMVLPTVFAGLTSLLVLYLLFKKGLEKPLEVEEVEKKLKHRILLISDLDCLGLCTIILIISSYINIDMYLVAMVFALLELFIIILYSIIRKKRRVLFTSVKRLPWSLIPFVLSMFIIVLMLENSGVTSKIATLFDNEYPILTYGVTSTLFCNLINNIPMSVLYSKIIPVNNLGALYSTIIGSNIGAFLSPIGALAGIMWLSILKKYDVDFSFMKFVKYGVIVVVPTLFAALLGLAIIL